MGGQSLLGSGGDGGGLAASIPSLGPKSGPGQPGRKAGPNVVAPTRARYRPLLERWPHRERFGMGAPARLQPVEVETKRSAASAAPTIAWSRAPVNRAAAESKFPRTPAARGAARPSLRHPLPTTVFRLNRGKYAGATNPEQARLPSGSRACSCFTVPGGPRPGGPVGHPR